MLLNSETWVGLTLAKEDIETLISVDGTLMRRLLEVPVSASKASLYLELGCIPMRYIIKARRLLFLQYLLRGVGGPFGDRKDFNQSHCSGN